jgi:hypothetical protein
VLIDFAYVTDGAGALKRQKTKDKRQKIKDKSITAKYCFYLVTFISRGSRDKFYKKYD